MKQYTALAQLAGRSAVPRFLYSQNGLKFRTLCKRCNTGLLGGNYDRTLNEFARSVGRILRSPVSLPSQFVVPTKPARLLRSLCGHLLAAKSEVEHTKLDEAMRIFVQDPSAKFPGELNVLYFVYPYTRVFIAHNIFMLSKRGQFDEIAQFSILKYFPIAYLVTSVEVYEGLQSFPCHRRFSLDDEVGMPICLPAAVERPIGLRLWMTGTSSSAAARLPTVPSSPYQRTSGFVSKSAVNARVRYRGTVGHVRCLGERRDRLDADTFVVARRVLTSRFSRSDLAVAGYGSFQRRPDTMVVRIIRLHLAVVDLDQSSHRGFGGGSSQSATHEAFVVEYCPQTKNFPTPVPLGPVGHSGVHGVRELEGTTNTFGVRRLVLGRARRRGFEQIDKGQHVIRNA